MCDGMTRRDMLRVGALGLGGLTLPGLLHRKALAGALGASGYVKDKAVILLFLAGGPSQFETWDPKPDGPGTSTSLAGHIPTALRGVRFASYFPEMAKRADRLTIVRSFHTNHSEHSGAHKQLLTGDLTVGDGQKITEPGIGSVYTRLAGPVNARTGMLRHAMIPPTTRHLPGKSIGFAGAYDSVVEGQQPAWLGAAYAPFETKVEMAEGSPREKKEKSGKKADRVPDNPLLDDLNLRLPDMRLDARRDLLRQMDSLDRAIDSSGAMDSVDAYHAQAIELLRGGAMRRAMDLSLEDPRTLAAYDTEHFRNYKCRDNSTFDREGPSIGISLGRQLLMARRLCEAGCGFVTVIHANWDFHARKGIPNMPEGMSVLAPPLDHAVAAFLDDIHARGLDDKITLIITGEFGRTPGLDENLGRHHFPGICPLVFAGGGFEHGQVIGRSDRRGGEPADQPISIADLHTTILHTMFDVGEMRLDVGLPRELVERVDAGTPIRGLF